MNLIRSKLIKDFNFPKEVATQIDANAVLLHAEFSPTNSHEKKNTEFIFFKTDIIKGYKLIGTTPTKIEKDEDEPLNISKFFLDNLPNEFWIYSHNIIFWESTDQYLILDEVDLNLLASDPEKTSIPLTNCFQLAGISVDNISAKIYKLTNPAAISNLESLLSTSVTKHIKKVWPEHPISIKFEINDNNISLLVEDDGVMYKAKTTSQRSDGFRQFISFLLTLSAENQIEELNHTLMLIDEPEAHLHPQAQINLCKELIKITSNGTDNIAFYATHSNYMIDKNNLERNIKVVKKRNGTTLLEYIPASQSSYSEVNFTVFDVATADYHNELYGYLEDTSKDKLDSLLKDKDWINERTGQTEKVSLSKYIRNSIHHPENTSNKAYTETLLRKSIKSLIKLKYGNK